MTLHPVSMMAETVARPIKPVAPRMNSVPVMGIALLNLLATKKVILAVAVRLSPHACM